MSHFRLKHKQRSSPKHKEIPENKTPGNFTAKRNLWLAPRLAFRFFDLPQEIQDAIYIFYFTEVEYHLESVCSKCAEDGFDAHKCLYQAKVSGCVPSLRHEQSCRKMARDSRLIRDVVYPKSLTFIEKVEVQELVYQFSTDPRYAWLRDRTTAISCRGVTKYAIGQEVTWSLLALNCPRLTDLNIEVRVRHEYVYWTNQYARRALQEDPDDVNRNGLNSANLHLTAGILQARAENQYHIRVESSHWWPLSTKAHKNCFTKVCQPSH